MKTIDENGGKFWKMIKTVEKCGKLMKTVGKL